MRANPAKRLDLRLNEDEPLYTLFNAARKGDLEGLKALIINGADINAKTIQDEFSFAHYAANRGDCEMLKWLKEKGADISVRSKHGSFGLHFGAENGHISVVQWYLQNGADLNDQNLKGWTVVHYAAMNGQIELLDCFKIKGADIFTKDKLGLSGLHLAASIGNLSSIRWYLENGADLNDQTQKGFTAVHFAASRGHIEILRFLKEKGADIFAKDKLWHSGIYFAVEKGHLSIIQWYLENKADLRDQDEDGWTAVHYAVASRQIEVLGCLKAKGADIFAKNKLGQSGLHVAAENGHLPTVQWYLENKADLNDQDQKGNAVVHLAALRGHIDILQWLKEKGSDIFAKNKGGHSGAQLAALAGQSCVIQWYVKNSHFTAFEMISEVITRANSANAPVLPERIKNNLKHISGFFLKQDPNCLLDRSKNLNQALVDNLNKDFETLFGGKSLQASLHVRANFTKAYQNKEFSIFLNALNDPLYTEFFKADIETFMQGKHPLLEGIIEEFLGFLLHNYPLAGPRYLLAELGAQLHDHYMEARRVDVEGAFHETDYHNLILSTLCILTQALSNPVYQGIYCMNLSALIGFKIKDKVYGVSTLELIRNYPNQVDDILQELKELYEQYIGRKLDELEPSLFDPQMRLILKEKLNQAKQEIQELKEKPNEFHKRPREEEGDNVDLGIKKNNAGFFSGRQKEELKTGDPSVLQKRGREEPEGLDDLMEGEDNNPNKIICSKLIQ